MKTTRLFSVLRILAILAGVLVIAGTAFLYYRSSAQGRRDEQVWRYLVSFLAGIILVVPHSRIFMTRMGPIWLALSFLLPVSAAYGLAWNVWTMQAQHKNRPALWVAIAIWLIFCANAECARRAFLSRHTQS